MAAHGGVERRWSDLPGDLLSAVYQRSASAYDRARFAAVCSTWRAAAARHPRLPALPLLLPSTGHGKRDREARAYSPEDGRILRVPLPVRNKPRCWSRLVHAYVFLELFVQASCMEEAVVIRWRQLRVCAHRTGLRGASGLWTRRSASWARGQT
jgi:hypothetical protein